MASSSSVSKAAMNLLRLAGKQGGLLGLGSSSMCSAPLTQTGQAGLVGLLASSIRSSSSSSASQPGVSGLVKKIRAYASTSVGARASATAVGGHAKPALPSLIRRFGAFAASALPIGVGQAAASATTGGAARLTVTQSAERLSNPARLALGAWVGFCGVWVYSMVVLGGITRLTRSGLSMTEWKLTGERAPSTQAEWQQEFEKYRLSPEFDKLHRGMTLEDFKFIYYMEYAHRMWGRLLGLAFALPAAFFAAKRMIPAPLGRRLGLLGFMGGVQGLVGWWMVRSGLQELEHEHATPRVSPYRLAAHLVSAFAIYATLAWTTLDLFLPKPATAGASGATLNASGVARRFTLPLAALIAVTATSGAFVAGMDAGRAYNTWPLMAGRLVPEEYVSPDLPPSRNIFENTAAVQFNHRALATTTLLAVSVAWIKFSQMPLPPRARSCVHALAGLTGAQFLLGIYTLLEAVPTHLGSMHQANALNLFTATLALLHALRPPVPGPWVAAAGPWAAPVAALAVGGIGYTVATQNGSLVESAEYRGPVKAL